MDIFFITLHLLSSQVNTHVTNCLFLDQQSCIDIELCDKCFTLPCEYLTTNVQDKQQKGEAKYMQYDKSQIPNAHITPSHQTEPSNTICICNKSMTNFPHGNCSIGNEQLLYHRK